MKTLLKCSTRGLFRISTMIPIKVRWNPIEMMMKSKRKIKPRHRILRQVKHLRTKWEKEGEKGECLGRRGQSTIQLRSRDSSQKRSKNGDESRLNGTSHLNRTLLPDYDGIVYTLDAKLIGNVGRYFNHSCSPNLVVQNVFVDVRRSKGEERKSRSDRFDLDSWYSFSMDRLFYNEKCSGGYWTMVSGRRERRNDQRKECHAVLVGITIIRLEKSLVVEWIVIVVHPNVVVVFFKLLQIDSVRYQNFSFSSSAQ